MASPTLTSVSYDRPGTMQIRTPGAPGSPGTGPIDMNSLYEMFKYKAATKAWEAQQEAAMREREMRLRERMQQAQLAAMQRAGEPQEQRRVQPGSMEDLAQRKAAMEVRDMEDVRNLRKIAIPMGPTQGVAYDWDTRVMNPIQQRAVTPANAMVANEGVATPGSAGVPIGLDLATFAAMNSMSPQSLFFKKRQEQENG